MTVDHDTRANAALPRTATPDRAAGVRTEKDRAVNTRADASATDHAPASWLLIAILSIVGFVILTATVMRSVVIPFDQPLLAFGQSYAGYPDVWNAISQSANIPLIVLGFGFVAWLFVTKRRREALIVLIMLAAVTAGSEGIKLLTARPRPAGNGDGIPGVVYSYPSGHELEVLTILGMIALRFWRSSYARLARQTVVVLVLIESVLVGFARLALNEHYPSDVLAGYLGAIAALAIYAWLTRPGAWADKPPAHPRDRDAPVADRSATHGTQSGAPAATES
jgi:undecaprenyl-diphosphatase